MNTAELVTALIARIQETRGVEPVPLDAIEELQGLLEMQEAA